MITVLTGDNTFELHRVRDEIIGAFKGTPEFRDAATLSRTDIPDIFMGTSLFAERRLIVIDGLSANTSVWSLLPEWLPRQSDDIHLVLIEPSLDRRTSLYKALKTTAEIHDFPAWTQRDAIHAETWAVQYAQSQGVTISRKSAAHLVRRVGLDQLRLSQALCQLALTDTAAQGNECTPDVIDAVVTATLEENVFQLIEDVLSGRVDTIAPAIASMTLTEDPHRFMALVVSQVFALVATTLAAKDEDPAKDFGVHPFVISKLRRYKSSLGSVSARRMLALCAQADIDMKSSKAAPWVLIERLLVAIAYRAY